MTARHLLGILLAISFPTLHAGALEDVLATLASKPLVRAHFVQQKSAPGLHRPLISTGELLFSRDDGVLISMQSPALSELVIGEGTIVQVTSGKQTRLRLHNSPYAAVADVLTHIANANTTRLLSAFEVESITKEGSSWHMRLLPRDHNLQAALSHMELSGDDYLRMIEIEDSHGAITSLSLAGNDTGPPLSDAERALFNLAH